MNKYVLPVSVLMSGLIGACQPVTDQEREQPEAHAMNDPMFSGTYEYSAVIHAWVNRTGNFQQGAFLLANTGHYFEAMEMFDRGAGSPAHHEVYFDNSQFRSHSALSYIQEQAADHRVVIINEAHHVPAHRFFTMLLIGKLRDSGFRYFGAETLSAGDSLLNERGYPLLNSGYFTAEPQYGNLVRRACELGYQVIAYEASGPADGRKRELEQAENIATLLRSDPEARVVIHCGYSHLLEEEALEGWGKAMAGRLKELTGIDPLTVDQVELTEHSDKRYENPYYQKMDFDDFTVVESLGRTLPVCFRLSGQWSDVFVYHPRTRLRSGRPDWLFRYYEPVQITSRIGLDPPVLVKAYYEGEDERVAVPADVVEILSLQDSVALALRKNRSYKVIVTDTSGNSRVLSIRS
jgi:hypothetical protein